MINSKDTPNLLYMSEIFGKTILITGAGGGLGVQMCRAFLQEGGRLILTDRNPEMLDSVCKSDLGHGKGEILAAIPADLSSREGCRELVENVRTSMGVPDILVNNAGIAVFGPFASVPEAKWEKILEINLYAPMRISHAFLPDMIARKSGHIVNISSVAGIVAVSGLLPYSVSKFGIKAFGEALSKELSSYGIYVTNLYPFFTRTPILESEQIGVKQPFTIPDFLLSEPGDVVARLVRGIRNNEVHVHPGGASILAEAGSRFFPGLLERLHTFLQTISMSETSKK